jgi:Na+/proline symporter
LLLNPLGALLFIALIVVPIWLLADVLLKRESLFRFYNGMENTLRKHVWISVPLIAIVLVNWFWNIAKGL